VQPTQEKRTKMKQKILHTADWHLGQTFYEYDRREEHAQFLAWLRKQLKEHEIDVLLIAGDVFDSPNPSAASQKMYYDFLYQAAHENPQLQVIIIAGNHDSAARLEAPNPVLEPLNVTVKGVVKRTPEGEIDFDDLLVPLCKGGVCLAVPYLRQGDYPSAEGYSQGVQAMYEKLYERVHEVQPVIAMGHLQATGSEISENDRSERTVIGGLECVSPASFAPEVAYTALGHLHRGQRVSKRENVRYSGAPLPMSFAEKNNQQGVVMITLEGAEASAKIERLPFDAPVKLLSLPAKPLPLDQVLAEVALLPEGEAEASSPFLELKVLLTAPEPALRHKIEEALEHKRVRLARVVAVLPEATSKMKPRSYEEVKTMHPMEMATDIFKRKYGGEEMPPEMETLLQRVIEEVER
jgi:exonuclease SbcD